MPDRVQAGAVGDTEISDVAWGKVSGEPTTLSGYGITDAEAGFNEWMATLPDSILSLDAVQVDEEGVDEDEIYFL